MGRMETDATSRNRIVKETGKNFFVEAGAGSGKTTMLVNRMVAMVEDGIDISKICAITFTKAAANEFYERFQKILIERSDPDYKWEDNGHAGQLPEPTEDTRKRCAEALQNIDLCFMGTIDSFCNMILSEHPSEAGILSDSQIITDADANEMYKQIYVRICNGGYGEELKSLANSFRTVSRNDKEVFCAGMNLLMDKRNAHFNFDTGKDADIDEAFADLRKDLIDTVNCLWEHQNDIKYDSNKDSREAWEKIGDIRQAVCRKWSSNYPSVLWALDVMKDIRVYPHALDRHGPSLSNFFEPGGTKGKWYECNIEKNKNFLPLLEKLQYNASMNFLLRCIPVIEKEMHDSGCLSYFDYLYYLRNMLQKDAEGEGKLINYIYNRHSYFLIDEFQDTNPMQAEVFFYLSSEKPVSKWYECKPRQGSLFIVGDPKQSIYRFRSADVTSFLRVKKLFEDGVGEILELSRNFRSKKCLCEYFNSIFTAKMSAQTNDQSKFEEIPLTDTATDEFRGVYNYRMEQSSDNAKNVAGIVKKLVNNENYLIRGKEDKELRPIQHSDIMVITYTKSGLGALIEQFTQQKIPAKIEGQVLFGQNEALHEMYRIYSAVVDTDDVITLYAALTGKTFALTKEELMVFRSCKGKLSVMSEFDIEGCDNETAKKVASALLELKELRWRSRNMSPGALLAYIMDHYKIYSIAETKNMEVVYFALELIRNAERTGLVSTLKDGKNYLSDLLTGKSDVERCLSLSDSEDRVRVANLHKVKGLEAPVVILSYTKKGSFGPKIRIQHDADSVEGYLFVLEKDSKQDKHGDYFSTSEFDGKEADMEKAALDAEDVRKLYVGATRARNVLIISDYGGNNDPWRGLAPESLSSIFDAVTEAPSAEEEDKGSVDAESLYAQAEEECVLNSRNAEDETYKNETPSKLELISKVADTETSVGAVPDERSELSAFASVIGTMTHKLMEIIVSTRNKVDYGETIREIISEYLTAAMIPYENRIVSALEAVADRISNGGFAQTNGLPTDILKTLLDADEVYCEVPFCYKEETGDGVVIWNGVMDVIYCSEGKWHIVDYKTNAEGNDLDTKYQNQLSAYIKAFKKTTGEDADALTYHIDV